MEAVDFKYCLRGKADMSRKFNMLLLGFALMMLGIYFFIGGVVVVNDGFEGKALWSTYHDPAVHYDNHSNISSAEDESNNKSTTGPLLVPAFGKLVIVLVDALRADYVLGSQSHMMYTHAAVQNGRSVAFTSVARPPTVTMPRIKALTTGSIPGFMDIVFNMNSAALVEDNIVAQLRASGRGVVFHGDDTWLKLFPGEFVRSDGTTSFFVTDYTVVDTNVTRHLSEELAADDWDVLILHYLGLDHIGHLQGPASELVGPKLREMDAVVAMIDEGLTKRDETCELPSLLVLCGDHGMSDAGSHGGASSSEVETPLVFFSSVFQLAFKSARRVEQVDFVPTLAALLGFPIPQNSLGVAIHEMLESSMSEKAMLKALQVNAFQLTRLLRRRSDDIDGEVGFWEYKHAVDLHNKYLTALRQGDKLTVHHETVDRVTKMYQQAMTSIAARLTAKLSRYDEYSMTVGIVLLWLGVIVLVLPTDQNTASSYFLWMCLCISIIAAHLWACTGVARTSAVCESSPEILVMVGLAVAGSATAVACAIASCATSVLCDKSSNSVQNQQTCDNHKQTAVRGFLRLGIVLHILSFASSSFVEEEHQTWYFFFTSLNVLILASHIVSLAQSLFNGKELRNAAMKPATGTPHKKFHETCPANKTQRSKEGATANDHESAGSANLCFTGGDTPSRDQMKNLLRCLLVLVLARLLRDWNHTGSKWAHLPDVGDWLNDRRHLHYLTAACFAAMLLLVTLLLRRERKLTALRSILVPIGFLSIYCFRARREELWSPWQLASSDGVTEARAAYACAVIVVAEAVIRRKDQLFTDALVAGWTLLSALLLRPSNIPVLAMISYVEELFKHSTRSQWNNDGSVIAYLWLSQASFFWLGNSNSLATVDVAAGYVGLSGHQGALFILLSCAATYCGPVLCLLCLLRTLLQLSGIRGQHLLCTCQMLLCSRCFVLAFYSVVVYVEKYHLFIWSVFLPKLLYEVCHTVVTLVFVAGIQLILVCMTCLDKDKSL
ncbi:PREDICTED: GPI ethanolamine phosphate transferase 2-like [Priapulus caudatus]|uniref:GPI ethanolamine phosphate transferase 2-like n=1 Tax=Priapulus caudatus TaxID=37621 RepID=A0ABM1DNU6_PRICU|nr:PREDICTED: GPI ethanolamine phosphate transferase 2-like [Priapulus caudatus]